MRLHLFDILRDGPQTLADSPRASACRKRVRPGCCDAAVALRLAEHRGGGRYGLGKLGHAMVGNPGVAAMIEHHALLYADLADPVALLRGVRGPTALGATGRMSAPTGRPRSRRRRSPATPG